jgi:hypothetical protein
MYFWRALILHNYIMETSNDNGVTIVKFDKSKNKLSRMQYRKIHKCTWISPDGKIYNQTDHISIYRRWHLSVPDYLFTSGS